MIEGEPHLQAIAGIQIETEIDLQGAVLELHHVETVHRLEKIGDREEDPPLAQEPLPEDSLLEGMMIVDQDHH